MNRNRKQISDEKLEQVSDEELAQAIRSFRQSVTAWSENQAARLPSSARRVHRPVPAVLAWWMAAGAAGATVAACALAAVMLTSGHRTEMRPMAQSATVQQAAPSAADAAPAASTAAATESASTEEKPTTLEASLAPVVNKAGGNAEDADEKLLAGIDSDIAQGTPKALAPMAGWMGDSAEQ